MQQPLRITARNFPLSEAVETEIRDKAARLDRYYERIVGCDVIVEGRAVHHHRKGGPFSVRIGMTVPGGRIAVNHQSEEELAAAIREAFDAARRRLEDYAREQRGDVKTQAAPARARVSKLFAREGYGFLETREGREVYFHRNSVIGSGFDELKLGAGVRFAEEEGAQGPQASTVIPAGKHGKAAA